MPGKPAAGRASAPAAVSAASAASAAPKVGLALAGGGPLFVVYEIGALGRNRRSHGRPGPERRRSLCRRERRCHHQRFGEAGRDDTPISVAVQASSAVPGRFPPVEIGGHHFVDGALRKTMHGSIALEHGVDLLLCVNPIVPYNARFKQGARKLTNGGLLDVLSQTVRSIQHSRLETGLASYQVSHRGVDILLFQPSEDDAPESSPWPLTGTPFLKAWYRCYPCGKKNKDQPPCYRKHLAVPGNAYSNFPFACLMNSASPTLRRRSSRKR